MAALFRIKYLSCQEKAQAAGAVFNDTISMYYQRTFCSSSVCAAIFLFSYLLYAEVLRENTYLSRTVEVQQGQKVINTGLYGIVRHPMYSVTIILFLAMPLVLGSIISFAIFLTYPAIIAKRIRNEESVLEKNLDGYIEYKKKVRYRIIPFVW